MKCIQSKEPIHVILDGTPASAKSMFLLEMQKKLDRVYYVDSTNATGPGLVEYLFNNDVQFLLLDEVEKMSKSDQSVLLNVLETGVLTSVKVRKTMSKEMNLSVYATSNDMDAISKPFRSRFMEFSLPEYDFNEFEEIVVRLAADGYRLDREIAYKIASVAWYKMETKDVRDAIQLAKLVRSVDEVEKTARTIMKYKPNSQSFTNYF